MLILVSIYYLNQFNQKEIRGKFLEITAAEGLTIGNLLELSGQDLIKGGQEKLTTFLNHLYENESIEYIGLFHRDVLVYLLSRYEGFFPVVPGPENYRILDTAVGKVFETSARFTGQKGEAYRLYIGFNYEFLTTFEKTAGQNFYVVAALFSLVMIAVIALVFYFDKKFYSNTLELQQEKQEKDRFKELSLLTAEIAHEIKNPLNAIYLSFSTLEKYCSNDSEALFYREAIKGEVRRISSILEAYVGLSKEIKPHYAPLDLTAFIETFQFLMTQELEDKGIHTQIKINGPTTIRTDENLLKQILLNLAKNAMEAGAAEITILFTTQAGTLTLDICDNGKGIDNKVADSIFKPYFSTKTKGMGLGLHIVLRLVMAMQGEIRLLSHDSGNTRFQVRLPAAK